MEHFLLPNNILVQHFVHIHLFLMTAGRQEEEKERNNVQIFMSIEGHEA